MTAPLLALALTLAGTLAVAVATDGDPWPPPEPIPLPAAAIATPVSNPASTMSSARVATPRHAMSTSVRFPTVPPIRSTPMFVSTERTPVALVGWHRQALMRWYLPERPQSGPHMGY